MASVIDEYVEGFDGRRHELLVELRDLVRSLVPEAGETISYRLPTFTLNGNLVHFAAFERHIGFYPGPEGVELAAPYLGDLRHSKGAIQFPLDRPRPVDLVSHVVLARAEQQRARGRR